MTLPADATMHYSNLRQFNRSPAHYLASLKPREPTRDMRIGTAVHQMVLGEREDRPLVVYPGPRRQGKEWDAFEASNRGVEILTQPEWDDAKPVAEAVLADTRARELLDGAKTEVPLSWRYMGVPCSTGGVDVIGAGFIAEFKTTGDAQPERFARHAVSMLYHAQLAFYLDAARSCGHDVKEAYIISVETAEPYCVVVHKLSPGLLLLGAKSVRLWMEKYKQCAESNEWPGYTQAVLDMDAPEWMVDDEEA